MPTTYFVNYSFTVSLSCLHIAMSCECDEICSWGAFY